MTYPLKKTKENKKFKRGGREVFSFIWRFSCLTFGMLHKSVNGITLLSSQPGVYRTLKMQVFREKVTGILPGTGSPF